MMGGIDCDKLRGHEQAVAGISGSEGADTQWQNLHIREGPF
jgi:hypothetical protein